MNSKAKRITRILLQIIIMIAVFAALFWYVGTSSSGTGKSFIEILGSINPIYIALAFLSYFGINVLFTIRLQRVLAREGVKTSFKKTILAQYAGMLTSDVTPGRSGYILTPVYLKDQNVPATVSLSSILGIQSIEFVAKVIGAALAIVFLIQTTTLTPDLLLLAVAGIGLMLAGAILLILMSMSPRAIKIVQKIASHKLLARFTKGLLGKLEEYAENAKKTRKAFPEIALLTLACWILKGLEWYTIALAIGITINPNPLIGWLGFFLIHPLITALGFIPITPAGMGAQEWGAVIVLSLFAIDPTTALTFALTARGILILQDLTGIPQIAKTTSQLLTQKTSQQPPKT